MKNLAIHTYNELTQSEKHTYQCIESLGSTIYTMSQNEVADYCKVSTATVNRTLKKLGFTNLKEYKKQFQCESEDSISSSFNSHIVDLVENFPQSKINEIAKQIISIRDIYIVSFGMTSSVGFEFSLNLTQLGYRTTHINDSEQYKIVCESEYTKDKIFILISYKGEDVDMIKETIKIKHSNKMVLIAAVPSNPLSYHCHNILITNSLKYDVDFRSRITLNVITNKIVRSVQELY